MHSYSTNVDIAHCSCASAPDKTTELILESVVKVPMFEFIRVLVCKLDQRQALMFRQNGRWDFPFFMFSGIHPDNVQDSVLQLQRLLNVDPQRQLFTPAAELLGDFYAKYPPACDEWPEMGLSKMVWVEMEDNSFCLPPEWQWQNVEFIEALISDKQHGEKYCIILHRVVKFLEEDISQMRELWQPRFRRGWYRHVCAWFNDAVLENSGEVTGAVVQQRMNVCSTILRVESAKGAYFLKAPDGGTAELDITECIYNIMPERTLDVVCVSRELGSFVSKEFEHAYIHDEDDKSLLPASLKALGEVQRESLRHREKLIRAGCVSLGVRELITEIDFWMDDELLRKEMRYLMSTAVKFAPVVKARLMKLQDFNVPLTLTHGDFSKRNVGFKKGAAGEEKMILFDWQFAAVSHPFFDFHEIHEKVTVEERRAYLRMWSDFESLERCEQLYELAYPLGWLLKLRDTAVANRVNRPELNSEMAAFFGSCWRQMSNVIAHLEGIPEVVGIEDEESSCE